MPQANSSRFDFNNVFGAGAIPYGLTLKNYPFGYLQTISNGIISIANQIISPGYSSTNFSYNYPKNSNYPMSLYMAANSPAGSGFNSLETTSVNSVSGGGGGASSVLFLATKNIVYTGTGTQALIQANGADGGTPSYTGVNTLLGAGGGSSGGFIIIMT